MKMWKRKDGLDEMQKERRNSIGNQMFMVLAYALLIDTALYGQGIRWLEYPGNIMAIFMVCMGIYLVRLIANNAYLPARNHNSKSLVAIIIAVGIAIVLGVTWVILSRGSSEQVAEVSNNNTAMILLILSTVGIICALVMAIIKKINNKNDKDD